MSTIPLDQDHPCHFDNPNFRQRIGTTVPFVTDEGTTIAMPVPARVNFGNNVSPTFVGRDSAQVATRVSQPGCSNAFGTHCGGVSVWSVASGGRMGQVMGEDAVEVSPSATDCVEDYQAQNQIRGRAVVLGFPFPVPTASTLTPRLPRPRTRCPRTTRSSSSARCGDTRNPRRPRCGGSVSPTFLNRSADRSRTG